MVAAQAEWRSEVWWRFRAAAFVGGGSFTWTDVLPGSGDAPEDRWFNVKRRCRQSK
jgi:hypothetical protein